MKAIYYNTKSNQKKELEFVTSLARKLPTHSLIKQNYNLPKELITNKINIRMLEIAVKKSSQLSNNKKEQVLSSLIKLPDFVQVANSIKDVSIDVTIVSDNCVRHIEFHEQQHRNLSVSRDTPIFIDSVKEITFNVPRYTQRLIKDIWRFQYLPHYQIVWWDWFEIYKSKGIDMLLENTSKEFHLKDKFNFSDFWNL